ncbi:hypothetical protein [Deinococcus multiflagellatus]|uniref:Uncharacterized protein n=1 Tax=Deinococcus multiflagellatus TaxID=1656887 RepID=A0ABW1ZP65_9DEIO|nr:hypothetical protein [Deinococcus multiflagellatus]MBZ9715833.1 hypothetical protein [Deinococcus multiflagellatus]
MTPRRRGYRALSDEELASAHLVFLRQAYRTCPKAKQILDELAFSYAFRPNRIAIIGDATVVTRNVMIAVEALAAKLTQAKNTS